MLSPKQKQHLAERQKQAAPPPAPKPKVEEPKVVEPKEEKQQQPRPVIYIADPDYFWDIVLGQGI